ATDLRPATVSPDGLTATTGEPSWARLAITVLARTYLALLGGLAFWSVAPALAGWHSTVVLTGSMRPLVQPGDVLVYQPVRAAQLRVGQIALVRNPAHPGSLLSHRVAAVNADGTITTKGDANHQADSTPVPAGDVIGLGRLEVPKVGLPVVWGHDGRTAALLAFMAVTAAALVGAAADDRRRVRPSGAPAPTRPGRPLWPTRPLLQPAFLLRPPRLRPSRRRAAQTAMVVVGAAAVVMIGSPGTADAKYTNAGTPPASTFASARYFTCANAVAAAMPTASYPLGETSGTTAVDSSGHGHTGTYHGSITYGTAAPCPRDNRTAVTLNGSTGCISTATQFTN
ncbi:MAG: signal peptidase I, partial [Acidimicrobiales bacterium]